jgi:hypothetical protein
MHYKPRREGIERKMFDALRTDPEISIRAIVENGMRFDKDWLS